MKNLYVIAAMSLLLVLSGCLSTVHPIFTEKDLVFDPKLIGTWEDDPETDGYVQVTKATQKDLEDHPGLQKLAGKTYLVQYKNSKGLVASAYFGFMVKLGNKLYMDYYPAETPHHKKYDRFYVGHYLKMHTFYRISFKNDNSFELKQFDESYLKKLIENKKIRIRHETKEDGNVVVTAPTEELQQYILKYSDVPEAYYADQTSVYSRMLNY